MTHEMIGAFTMLDTGWAPATGAEAAFSVEGAALKAELRVFTASMEIADLAGGAEEVAAVLDGSFELRSDDDVYTLVAGQAVLIPPGAARVWNLESPRGTLYRVWRHAEPA